MEVEDDSSDKATKELENQIAHLKRSTAELDAILTAGMDEDGAPLSEEDRVTFQEAVEENHRALETKEKHLADLLGSEESPSDEARSQAQLASWVHDKANAPFCMAGCISTSSWLRSITSDLYMHLLQPQRPCCMW
eukprot:CAMPEP_0185190388 /NCGR_PEP_ID=MMETSP1140-20130426/8497_1 /TAXON_ID=298111 /ORGANISM="Pavlova sp., Strain CCMP459" /LENGTH=135 /DNA_ID=CAMNT_0027757017 /DNA_START=23 /DNA_END=428 /DNA_ORIENTATION=-